MKTICKNLLRAACVICYFVVLDFAYTRMNLERLTKDIEVFSGVFLVLGILTFEKAYREDKENLAVTGIEFLCLSFHSLSIMHMITMFKCDFRFYLIASSIVVAIYYSLKAIVCYTKEKRAYLKTLSDISEIVKEDEPVKKEAKKRSEEKREEEKEPKEGKEKIQQKRESSKTSKSDTKQEKNKNKKTKTRKTIKAKAKEEEKDIKKSKSDQKAEKTKKQNNKEKVVKK